MDKRRQYSDWLVDGQFLYKHLYLGEFFCLSLFKRNFLLKYSNLYKEGGFFEDVEYALKVAYYAKKVVYMDSCIYAYRQRGTSTIYTIDKKKVTDIIGASISVLKYLDDPSLGNDFKSVISYLQSGRDVKEYIISCGFNIMGGWNIVQILYPVVWLKKMLMG